MDGHNNPNRPRDPRDAFRGGGAGHNNARTPNTKRTPSQGGADHAPDGGVGTSGVNSGRGYSGYSASGGGGGGHHTPHHRGPRHSNLTSPAHASEGGGKGGFHSYRKGGHNNTPGASSSSSGGVAGAGGGGGDVVLRGGYRGKNFNPNHRAEQLALQNNPLAQHAKEREMLNIYGGGGKHDASSVGEGAGGGGKRIYNNPCRFAGHEHDWKDCPNNFRNKKKLKMGLGGHPAGGIGMGRGMGRGKHGHHAGPHHGGPGGGPGGAGPGGFGGGGEDTTGHYGPAAVNSSIDVRGGVDRRSGSIDRGSGGGFDRSTSTGSGLDRGYDVGLGSRSKSFGGVGGGDDARRGSFEGRGPHANSTSAGLFSPKAASAERGRSWGDRAGGYHGNRDHPRERSNERGSEHGGPPSREGHVGRNNSPFTPGTPHAKSHHHQHHSEPSSTNASQQPPPSPIGSMKSDRGYSFSATPLMRSKSSGSERHSAVGSGSGKRDRDGEQHGGEEDVIDKIAAPPLHGVNSSPGEIKSPRRPGLYGNMRRSLGGSDRSLGKVAADATAAAGAAGSGTNMRGSFSSPLRVTKPSSLGGGADAHHPTGTSKEAPSSSDSLYAGLGISPSPRGYSNKPVTVNSRTMGEDGSSTPRRGEDLHKQHGEKDAGAVGESSEVVVASIPKKAEAEKRPSLTCSSLKDPEKINKAEDIIAAMIKLTDFNVATGEGGVPLPTKMQITKCMAELENKIKDKGKDAMAKRKEVKAIEAKEVEEKERKLLEAEAEEERRVKEEEERVSQLTEDNEFRKREREGGLAAKKQSFSLTYEAQKSFTEELRQTQILQMKDTCQSEVDSQVSGVNTQISSLYTQLEETEKEITILNDRQIQRDRELSAATETLPNMIPEEDQQHKKDGTNVPTLDMPGKMSSLVSSILAQNQMIAKKNHLEVLESIPYFPDAAASSAAETAQQEGITDIIDPQTAISNEEWSNRARKVTGLHDALYTDPSSVPYYQQNNEIFLEIAPRIKECIRKKNKKLKSRWESLANQYVVRQLICNEKSGVTGHVSERGGYFSLAGMSNKEIDYNMDGSSSGSSPAGGGSSAPSVRGNNPYRRPRRGISPGDVVRSDYEQEQIIAEMVAKEAMEKRIKEGGCSLPRQRGWLENVSDLQHVTFHLYLAP